MTSGGDVRGAMCQDPIDPAVLADYWLALLPPAEQDRVERHLFDCDACGDALRGLIRFCDALRTLARSGALRVVVGEGFAEHAATTGRRVRRYDFAPGQIVPCTIAADDDLLIARLAADLRGTQRVDLSFCDPRGVERQRLTDIPVRAEAGRVILHESAVFAKTSPSTTMLVRLLDVRADGDERLLGEYTFQHTREIPGPPDWEW